MDKPTDKSDAMIATEKAIAAARDLIKKFEELLKILSELKPETDAGKQARNKASEVFDERITKLQAKIKILRGNLEVETIEHLYPGGEEIDLLEAVTVRRPK